MITPVSAFQYIKRQWRNEPVVRLTTAYVGILMVLCVLFTSILYMTARSELEHALMAPPKHGELAFLSDREAFVEWRTSRYEHSHGVLLFNLFVFDCIVVVAGGIASYFFARRTFRPIQRALEAQSRFAGDAAHELRTPLAIMKTEIDVALRAKTLDKSDALDILRSNAEEVERMQHLTDRLLQLAGNEEMPKNNTRLQVVFDAISSSAYALAEQKQMKIMLEPTGLSADIDATSIQNCLMILIENAVKYSPEKTTITVRAFRSNGRVRISVKDEGVGIAAEDQAKVFERFYRVDESRSVLNVSGHGLGLSLARRIMELHGGEISVKSTPKKGSTFTLSFMG